MNLATDSVVGTPIPSPYGQVTRTAPGAPVRGIGGSILLRRGPQPH